MCSSIRWLRKRRARRRRLQSEEIPAADQYKAFIYIDDPKSDFVEKLMAESKQVHEINEIIKTRFKALSKFDVCVCE